MNWDHWVAFTLLFVLDTRMIFEGIRKETDEPEEAPRRHGFWLLVTGYWLLVTRIIATSLDAMAVNVGLAFLQVNIVVTALAIGAATTTLAASGMLLGRLLPDSDSTTFRYPQACI